ncbi:FAD-dependent monooxygenase [Yoonia sp. 208BN28-4]|uniref:FAD-dependent monooxygenase n=1 Tax=Yoonia sp. 208BN28-4 TaxID=3126505 RepID=UPI0030B422A5
MGHNAGRSIAVVGGGIGGLTAALAFARTGARVTVHEQAAALTEVGAGLQITPNGARVLHALGLSDQMDRAGLPAAAVCPTDALTGRRIARFDLTGRDYRFFHRADLIDMLAQSCAQAGVEVRTNARVQGMTGDGMDDETSPILTIGADGLKSVCRSVLNPTDKPFFTGQVAWRAMVPMADVAPEAKIWMAPGRHVVTYPLTGGRLNIVAVQERDSFAEDGWHHHDDPANLRAAFNDVCPVLADILGRVDDVRLWGLFRYEVAQNWHGTGLALLGDAAHPTLPFLAQGANLAIEDAFVLAQCCDRDPSVEKTLPEYQEIRRPRVMRAIAAANANARNYHLSGFRRRVAHAGLSGLGKIAPDAFLNRMDWLYGHDVTTG